MKTFLIALTLSLFALPLPAAASKLVKPPPHKPEPAVSVTQTEPAAGGENRDAQETEKSATEENKPAAGKTSEPFPYVGDIQTYVTKYEDTMIEIARKNDLGFVELRAANPNVDPWMPGANVELVLPTRHLLPDAPRKGIVINLAAMRLFHYREPGKPPESYPVGIGREGLLTPTGQTTVRSKIEGPIWRPTKRMREEKPELPEVVYPGPDNPMGTHALYLGWNEYAIHGTDKPYAIGRRVSSGCIRMYPEDIVSLYPEVPSGTPVTVVDQPVRAAWIDDGFYIEAHPSRKQADVMEESGGIPSYEMTQQELETIVREAGDAVSQLDWQKVRTIVRERRGYPVLIMSESGRQS